MPFEGEEFVQDANETVESSAPQESSQENVSHEQQSSAQTAEGQSKPESSTPFHEHPRWKEREEQFRSTRSELEATKAAMEQMQRQMFDIQQRNQPPKQANPFVEKLREINPEYASYIESLEARAAKADQLETRISNFEQNSTKATFENSIEKMHAENQAPKELQSRIRQQIEFQAMTNPKLRMSDLPNLYKQIFEQEKTFMENIKRSTTASYVKDKSKDNSTPASPNKGKAPNQKPGSQQSAQPKDQEEMRSLIAKEALKKFRAASDL